MEPRKVRRVVIAATRSHVAAGLGAAGGRRSGGSTGAGRGADRGAVLRRGGAIVGMIVSAAVGALCVLAPSVAVADPLIAAAGDIACKSAPSTTGSSCHYGAVSDLIVNDPAITDVLAIGDVQYECGDYPFFLTYYDPTWGRFRSKTHPVPGNHEYDVRSSNSACDVGTTTAAKGYYDYFNGVGNQSGPAGSRSQGYYSFDVGTWHLVALNSNCSRVSCSAGSAQESWLRGDLAAHPDACILAYWHHARFASGSASKSVQPLWRALSDAHAAVVLSGHAHFYERFARLGPQASSSNSAEPVVDPNGIREFIVGTGGRSLFSFDAIRTGSEVRSKTYGVLKLGLHAGSYDWRFVAQGGASFTDTGSESCGAPTGTDQQPPTAPPSLTAGAASASKVDLGWAAASDNVGVTGYRIERRTAGGSFVQFATTGGTTTSYSDTQVTPSTSYDYQVRAVDAAANVSDPSPIASVRTPAGDLAFAPAADAKVRESFPGTNYGSDSLLETDRGTGVGAQSYLRFVVTGVSGAVQSARLRLYVSNGTSDGPAAVRVVDTTWAENAINWDNRPPLGAQLDDKPALATNTFTEYDVTAAVTGDGTYSFALGPTPTTDGADFRSREATSNPPRLLVTVP